ncbi:MAG: nucleotide pyrophosphohydrolase [Planctomycetota bacterium]|nr:MAG: nucleotide pyrophosphohydrolase [Planctomycetota bacterium]
MASKVAVPCDPVTLETVQTRIRALFGAKDARRGLDGTFMWFMEEVGELASGLRGGDATDQVATEFADVLAWLATLANIRGVDLGQAFRDKYGLGCPGCRHEPCDCLPQEKP